jgi:hypothetical protein
MQAVDKNKAKKTQKHQQCSLGCMLFAPKNHLQSNAAYLFSCTVEAFHVIIAAHLFRHDMHYHVSKVKHFPAPTARSVCLQVQDPRAMQEVWISQAK